MISNYEYTLIHGMKEVLEKRIERGYQDIRDFLNGKTKDDMKEVLIRFSKTNLKDLYNIVALPNGDANICEVALDILKTRYSN